jgi:uncharacterized protein (DUF488 family)
MTDRLYTVGVYGFSEEAFYETLARHAVDALVDIRQRRGVRGAQYAFANARRLEAGLGDRHITYLHLAELAPTADIRDLQKRADARSGVGKRARPTLTDEFVAAYRSEILTPEQVETAATALASFLRPALLCVEAAPAACHRSLASQELARVLHVDVDHLSPGSEFSWLLKLNVMFRIDA